MWGGVEAMLSLSSRVVGPIFVEVSGAVGYSLLPVHALADGERIASLDAFWLRPALGVGAEF